MDGATWPDRIPALDAGFAPPQVCGVAALAELAFAGAEPAALRLAIERTTPTLSDAAAFAFDAAIVQALQAHHESAAALQRQALAVSPLFRIADTMAAQSAQPLRVLALLAPGDLAVNTPLDFLTRHLDVRLDLLFVVPCRALPAVLPDHDVAFCAVSNAAPVVQQRVAALQARWPRPMLNDPARVLRLSREVLAIALRRRPELICPAVRRVKRAEAFAAPEAACPPASDFPVLVRPAGTATRQSPLRAADAAELKAHLATLSTSEVWIIAFIDCRGADGLYRRFRIAFIDGVPYLGDVAVSDHWRCGEPSATLAAEDAHRAVAHAIATFKNGFARRHGAALAAIREWAGLDYFQIDCAETADGRLVLFGADVAGIIRATGLPNLCPDAPAEGHRILEAFSAMLARAAGRRTDPAAPIPPAPRP